MSVHSTCLTATAADLLDRIGPVVSVGDGVLWGRLGWIRARVDLFDDDVFRAVHFDPFGPDPRDWSPRTERSWVVGPGVYLEVERLAVERLDREQAVGSADSAAATVAEPLTSWDAIATALGISTRTLARRRAKHDPDRAPWFGSPEDARRWYTALGRPAARRARASRGPARRQTGDPLDAAALVRDLTRGR